MFAKLAPLVMLTLLCGGCIAPRTAGREFNVGYVDHIIIGSTGRTEVLANLGPPLKKFSPDSDANETWIWSYESSGGGPRLSFKGTVQQVLRVTFADGVVADCMFFTSVSAGTLCGGGKLLPPPT